MYGLQPGMWCTTLQGVQYTTLVEGRFATEPNGMTGLTGGEGEQCGNQIAECAQGPDKSDWTQVGWLGREEGTIKSCEQRGHVKVDDISV